MEIEHYKPGGEGTSLMPLSPVSLEEPVQEGETVRTLLSVPFKWKWLILGVCVVVFLPVAIASLFKSASYQARVAVIIKQDRAYLALTSGSGEPMIRWPASSQTINSEIQIVKSREVIERAVQELEVKPPQIQKAVAAIRSSLSVSQIPDSNIMHIALQGKDPAKTVEIVNTVAEAYLEQHARINSPSGASRFFEKQADMYQHKLAQAQEQLGAFELQTGITDASQEVTESLGQIAQLENEQHLVEVQLGEQKRRITFLKQQIKQHPQWVTTSQDTVINPAVSYLRRQLAELHLEKNALLHLYTQKDRRVIAKQDEIDTLLANLAAEQTHVEGRKSTQLNGIRRALEQELLTSQGQVESLRAKQQTLESQLTGLRQHLDRLKQMSFAHQQLKQATEINQSNYTLYRKKSEDTRISEEMDREKLLNVSIIERAALPLQPQPSRTSLSLLLAAFTGIAVGIGGAFSLEFFNRSFKQERDVEKHLGLPVLATIEYFQT